MQCSVNVAPICVCVCLQWFPKLQSSLVSEFVNFMLNAVFIIEHVYVQFTIKPRDIRLCVLHSPLKTYVNNYWVWWKGLWNHGPVKNTFPRSR